MRVKKEGKNKGQKWGTKICLIKCLKGHKSLESLCNVVKALIDSGNRQTELQTMSPIELFWTTKKAIDNIHFQIFGEFPDF